ncbi:MAG: vitamin K epoxide reductase family protein [Candidatus Altimarinota bacterium]
MKKLYAILILALASLGNAIYLTISAFNYKAGDTSAFFCDVNDTLSCSNLFAFPFAWIFGIPFPAIAMVVYPIIALIALLAILGKTKKHFIFLLIIALMGMSFNSYIIYNEYLIGIYCLACLACSIAITSIAILSGIGIKEKSNS